jgi:methylenetetrahydrofolate reductase (NADPH)
MNKLLVQNFVRNYSIETTVPEARRVEQFTGLVDRGTEIYIPFTPGTQFPDMVALALRLGKEGFIAVPHIVARRIESIRALDEFLAKLAGDAGVTQVLVVAGDTATPVGQLRSTLEILDSGLLEKHGIQSIGVAGHPEGHRELADPVLRDALQRKNAYAQRTGAKLYVVTQFTFSADPIIAWENSHGSDIGRMPVTAGLPGLATARTLLKYAMDCGVGPSVQAFSKRYASLTRLLTISAPDRTIVTLAQYKNRTPHSRLRGVHFFPFGGFKKTAEWANRIVAGDFELTEEGGLA